ncbi:MAG: hypothetical protein Q4F13_00475 [Pseudomonadota bacterium]|nr:hypothetical protein [Pseudomonadota bacterium]
MSDVWTYLLLAFIAVAGLVFLLTPFILLWGAVWVLEDMWRKKSAPVLRQDMDDVECPCCGLSPLESVRSTTGEDACLCCGRRPYRVRPRRRRKRNTTEAF